MYSDEYTHTYRCSCWYIQYFINSWTQFVICINIYSQIGLGVGLVDSSFILAFSRRLSLAFFLLSPPTSNSAHVWVEERVSTRWLDRGVAFSSPACSTWLLGDFLYCLLVNTHVHDTLYTIHCTPYVYKEYVSIVRRIPISTYVLFIYSTTYKTSGGIPKWFTCGRSERLIYTGYFLYKINQQNIWFRGGQRYIYIFISLVEIYL